MIQENIVAIKDVFLATIAFDFILFIWFIKKTKFQTQIAKIFLALLFFILLWETAFWLSYFTYSQILLENIDRFMFSVGGLAIFLSLYFIWELTEHRWLSKKIVMIFGAVSSLFAVFSIIPGVVLGARIYLSDTQFNFTFESGYLFAAYHLFFALLSILTITLFYKSYRSFTGLKKQQVQLVGFGLMISIIFATSTAIGLPLLVFVFGDLNFIGNPSVIFIQIMAAMGMSVFTGMSAYAITRYRFLNMRVVIQKSLLHLLIVAILLGLLGVVIYSVYTFANSFYYWVVLFTASITIVPLINRHIKEFVDKKCFVDAIDLSQHVVDDRLQKLKSDIDISITQLVVKIKEKVNHNIQYLFLIDRQHNRYSSYYPIESNSFFSIDSGIYNTLSQLKNITFLNKEISIKNDKLYKFCKKENIDILLTIRDSNRILGVLGLKEKKLGGSNEVDNLEEILEILEIHLPVIVRMRDTFEYAIRQNL